MSMPKNLHGYHVHIYFDDTTKARATELHDILVEQLKGQPSRPQFIGIAGPHPIPQMQAIFPKDAFTADVLPWLMFNRQGLDILIHPLTDDEVEDHTAHAVWLGKPVELLTDKLKHGPTIAELMPTYFSRLNLGSAPNRLTKWHNRTVRRTCRALAARSSRGEAARISHRA